MRTTPSRCWVLGAAVAVFLGFSLACSGVTGPSVWPNTQRLAEHLSQPGVCGKNNDDGCPPVRLASGHQEAQLGDWMYQIGEPFLTTGEKSLPYIRNSSERKVFSREGVMALVVPVKYKNTSPVAKKLRKMPRLKDTLGETKGVEPYNSQHWAKSLEMEHAWDAGKAPPDKWIERAYVYAVQEAGVDGAALYFQVSETRRYPTGRKYEAVSDHLLIELPAVTRREGPLPWRKDGAAAPPPARKERRRRR